MHKITGVLALIGVGVWLMGCAVTDAVPQAAAVGNLPQPGNCGSTRGTAVSINLTYENNMIIEGVEIMYRRDGGEWIVHEEYASGSTFIEGPAGKYEIKAQKDEFFLESATVIVPNDRDCHVLKQDVNFSFSKAACLTPIPIAIEVARPSSLEGVILSVRTPTEGTQEWQCDPTMCFFNLSPSNTGTYEVRFSGFSNHKDPILEAESIRYLYTPVEVIISVENRRHHIISEAVDTLTIEIPYGLAENGCYEVDFYGITADATQMLPSESGTISEESNMQINSLSSPICSQTPIETQLVRFNVNIPTGTPLSHIRVEYWKAGSWHLADCEFSEGYVCVAEYNNPLIADKYHVRTVTPNQELLGMFIPLDGKCISFE